MVRNGQRTTSPTAARRLERLLRLARVASSFPQAASRRVLEPIDCSRTKSAFTAVDTMRIADEVFPALLPHAGSILGSFTRKKSNLLSERPTNTAALSLPYSPLRLCLPTIRCCLLPMRFHMSASQSHDPAHDSLRSICLLDHRVRSFGSRPPGNHV